MSKLIKTAQPAATDVKWVIARSLTSSYTSTYLCSIIYEYWKLCFSIWLCCFYIGISILGLVSSIMGIFYLAKYDSSKGKVSFSYLFIIFKLWIKLIPHFWCLGAFNLLHCARVIGYTGLLGLVRVLITINVRHSLISNWV